MARTHSEVPLAMRRVSQRLERWRRKRTGRSPIPEPLWIAAGELAREHGVNPVARALRLEYNHLRRMAGSDRPRAGKRRTAVPFVELVAPATVTPSCVIELEGQRGTLRVEWRGTTADLASFSRTLWEMVS